MNKNLYIAVLFFFLQVGAATLCIAGESHDYFTQAAQLYKEGDYQQSIDTYDAIKNKDAATYYNIGNGYFRLGKLGHALLFWRRAERHWPLFTARRELLDNITLVSHHQDYTHSYFVSLLRSVPLIFLQLLFLCLWALLFVYARKLYRRNARGIIIVLFSAVTIVGILLAVRYSLNRRNSAIIISSDVTMHSGPGNYPVIGHLDQAQEIVVKKQQDGYCKVLFQGKMGWIDTAHLEVI